MGGRHWPSSDRLTLKRGGTRSAESLTDEIRTILRPEATEAEIQTVAAWLLGPGAYHEWSLGKDNMLSKLFYFGPTLTALHEEYAKKGRVDEAAPLQSSESIVIDAPVERVWRVVSDLRNWPAWHPPIQMLELTSVSPDAPFRWKLGGATIRSVFAVVEPERELTWTGLSYGFKAVDRHLLEPVGGGRTRVLIEESLAGPLLPLLYSSAKLRAAHRGWLTALKTFVEKN